MSESWVMRLQQQMEFLIEMDKLKSIYRQTHLMDKSRNENDAEHSWHLAIMALFLSEHAREDIDVCRVIKMVLIHDIVEIDAGDTFAYDSAGSETKRAREVAAAERIFPLLPSEQAMELWELWEEFETGETPEAQFANSLDRMAGALNNLQTGGMGWRRHGVSVDRVLARNAVIEKGSPVLWEYLEARIEEAAAQGVFSQPDSESPSS
jgi:putative hydrolase of HD superfamily